MTRVAFITFIDINKLQSVTNKCYVMCGLVRVCFKSDNSYDFYLVKCQLSMHRSQNLLLLQLLDDYIILKDLILLLDIGIKKLKVTKKKNQFTLLGSRN